MSDTNNTTIPKDKKLSFVARSATRYLWCDCCSERCHCSHDLGWNSKNSDPASGHCQAAGCPCTYFTPYRVQYSNEEEEDLPDYYYYIY